MTAARAALLRDLAAVARRVADDVLLAIATRVWAGQAHDGCLRLARDRRDFRREGADELVDACFYLTAEALKRDAPRRRERRRA